MWTGVDLFFVLSGFLITGILLDSRNQRSYFSTFYARRALRIFPLYYLFLFVTIPGLYLTSQYLPQLSSFAGSETYQRLWQGQGWLWLYVQNFAQAEGPSRLPGMGHLWSLAVEEQFYLLWPILIYFLNKKILLPTLALSLLIAWITRLASSLNGTDPWAIMHLTYYRLDGLLVGSLVALVVRNASWNRRFRHWQKVLLAMSTTCVAFVWIRAASFDWTVPIVQQYGYLAFNIGAGCLVYAVVDSSHDTWWARILCFPFLRSCGKYSYAAYVFHWPIICALKSVVDQPDDFNLGLLLTAGILSFLSAWLSWHIYEKHWLRLRPAYAPPLPRFKRR